MLEAEKLSKRYGSALALDNLNLHIRPGEIFCLLGTNGAGKTTTINLFLSFIVSTSGTAKVDGLDVTKYPQDVRRIIAHLPEQVMLYPRRNGLENLDYFTRLGPQLRQSRTRLFPRTMWPSRRSSGKTPPYLFKRHAAESSLAIALAKEARALLLDDPTSGLDPQASFEFSQVLAGLARDGVAVPMATHDLFRVKETRTRAGIMRQGRLVDVLDTKSLGPVDLERLYLDHMRAAPFREAAQ